MVKTNTNAKARSSAVTDRSSTNASASYADNTFCVVLHVVEAINFYGREMREGERDQIIMNAALNTVDFEVEGTPSVTTETIIFNSNCIWECDLAGIKRIKTDHRPVKVTFFAYNSGSSQRKTIGSLLLPVRGIPVLGLGGNNSALQLKMFWHKLICISNEFRSHKPEVLLMLTIIKKSLLHTKEFKHLMVFNSAEKQPRVPPLQSPGQSITANMLQSQANVYVQSLVQLGLLQVGNNPLVDCDIIEVVLQFKQLKNLNRFVKSLYPGKEVNVVLLMFDFVGNVTNIELKLNDSDCYKLDDVLGLRFKSSLRSIRLYFQRIFYLPINMYINGASIANYRMDFGKLLPSDKYFADNRKFTQSGCFAFERFGRMASARELKPIMEYTFTVDIQEVCWHQQDKAPDVRVSQQLQQMEQDTQDQISLNCVGSKAVIHEVPKDRVNEGVGDWSHLTPDEHCKPENVSINSLNIGAELSDSDERESVMESAPDDAPDSDVDRDADGDDHKFHVRRKKFTRLLEMEQQDANILDLQEDVESEAELLGLYNNSKFCRDNSNADDENMPNKTLKYSQRTVEELSEVIQTNRKQRSARAKNPNDSVVERQSDRNRNRNNNEIPFQDDQIVNASAKECRPKKSGRKSAVIEENVFDSSIQLEQEEDRLSEVSDRINRINKETTAQVDPIPIPKVRQSKILSAYEMDPNLKEVQISGKKPGKKNCPKDDSLVVEPRVTHKKKVASKNEEFKLLEAAEMEKIMRKSENVCNSISQNRYLMSDDNSFVDAENNIEFECQTQKSVKKPRKRVVEESEKDVDTTTDTEKREKANARKSKSKVLLHVESEVCEKVIVKKPQNTKKTAMSKTDLCLSARWVEVNRDQVNSLEETERYIGQLNETSYEQQMSESSRRSSKNKTEHMNAHFSSEIDDSSFLEEQLRETKVERKVLKKNKATNESWEDQKPSEGESQATNQLKSKTRIDTLELRHIYDATAWEQPGKNTAAQSKMPDAESSEPEVRKKPLKKKVTKAAAVALEDNCDSMMKSAKSQLDLDGQVSRLEVTVHMYDQSKAFADETTTTKGSKEGVNTSTSTRNLDESIKQILAVSMELKDDMQLKALEYLRSLGSQGKAQTPLEKKQSQTAANESLTVDANYEFKFNELEQHIVVLENHLRQFESRTLEMQEENSKLAQEKMQLKQRISHMEQQIIELRQHTTNGSELKEMITEMRQQNVRYHDMSKARDRYKKQWRRAAKRIHALKLAMYEKNVQHEYQSVESNVLNLKSILTQDADDFEREYGRFRKPNSAISFSASGDSSEPLLKDYLRVLSNQTLDKHKPANSVDSTRMH
ncbi:hypothetical protein ACLKA6_007471 [Drosophila palustris]